MSSSESMVETEVKLPVDDVAQIRKILSNAGFEEAVPRSFEVNCVYDRPSGEIRARGELLRVRRVAGETVMTFKGKAQITSHKTREELEIRISDYETCKLILDRLGFVRIFRYEKYRTEFRRPDDMGVVMLDETPIGTFLELEGKASWIDQVAETLGYPASQYITASYGALYLEYCRTRTVVPEDMVFS